MGRAIPHSDIVLSRDQHALIDRLAMKFEQAWKQNTAPRIEDFLSAEKADPSVHGALLQELIALDIEYRERQGELPLPTDYQARFSESSDLIEAVFQHVCPSARDEMSGQTRSSDRKDMAAKRAPPCDEGNARERVRRVYDNGPLPQRIGRYEILRLIAEGGFGRVLLARDSDLSRLVAIKISRTGLFSHEKDVARFLKEAKTAAQLKHPNIVAIHDVGRDGALGCYIVMDFVDGGPLDAEEMASRMSFYQVASLIAQTADAIHHAHTKGLVHRDLKPGNILLDSRSVPYVSDFGLAVHESVQQDYEGEISGTPPYMSPEQVQGMTHRMDGRTDIWSLGVILYELLTGRRPFVGRTREKIFDEILHRDPKPPRQINDAIPVALERVCLKALSKQPAERYRTALDMADELRDAIADSVESHLLLPPAPPPLPRSTSKTDKWQDWKLPLAGTVGGLAIVATVLAVLLWPDPNSIRKKEKTPEIAKQLEKLANDGAGRETRIPEDDSGRQGVLRSADLQPEPANWTVEVTEQLQKLHTARCTSLTLAPNADLVASADTAGNVCLSSLQTGQLVNQFAHGQPVTGMCLARDGTRLAVLVANDEQIHEYSTQPPFLPLASKVKATQDAGVLLAGQASQLWLVTNDSAQVAFRNLTTGSLDGLPTSGSWQHMQVAINHDQRAAAGYDTATQQWHVALDLPLRVRLDDLPPVCSLAVATRQPRLAVGCYGVHGGLMLVHEDKITLLKVNDSSRFAYHAVAFSQDEQRLLAVSWRSPGSIEPSDAPPNNAPMGVISVWDLSVTSAPIETRDVEHAITAVALAPPYICLASDESLHVYQLAQEAAEPGP